MKFFRCDKCKKSIRTLKSGMVQWIHSPGFNQSKLCQIVHIDCESSLKEYLIVGYFTEEILLKDIILDELELKWNKTIYQDGSFQRILNRLVEKL